MAQPSTPRILDIIDLEREIEDQIRNNPPLRELRPLNIAPPTQSMPDYVEHCEGATEIGKLSAEAVVREYESAAKQIEEMGAELIARVRDCEAMTRDALAATQEMRDTAARYREEAKRIFVQIENCTLMTAEVRKTCTQLKERIAAPPTMTG